MARDDMAMLIQEISTCLLISIDLKNDSLLNNEFQNNESDFLSGPHWGLSRRAVANKATQNRFKI